MRKLTLSWLLVFATVLSATSDLHAARHPLTIALRVGIGLTVLSGVSAFFLWTTAHDVCDPTVDDTCPNGNYPIPEKISNGTTICTNPQGGTIPSVPVTKVPDCDGPVHKAIVGLTIAFSVLALGTWGICLYRVKKWRDTREFPPLAERGVPPTYDGALTRNSHDPTQVDHSTTMNTKTAVDLEELLGF